MPGVVPAAPMSPACAGRALLARVAEGGGAGVMNELNRLTHPRAQTPVGQAMSCVDFAAKSIKARELRQKKEAATAAAQREREEQLRKQHLASVLRRADTIWAGLNPLMDQKVSSAYDQAATQLQELRDAYAQAGDTAAFEEKLAGFRRRYSNRPAMPASIPRTAGSSPPGRAPGLPSTGDSWIAV